MWMCRRFPLLALCFAALLCGASAQQTVTLGNGTVALNPNGSNSGGIPGWTSRGYKDLSSYAWYSLRGNIRNGQGALALMMPEQVDDS
jgi:hypothetical protein